MRKPECYILYASKVEFVQIFHISNKDDDGRPTRPPQQASRLPRVRHLPPITVNAALSSHPIATRFSVRPISLMPTRLPFRHIIFPTTCAEFFFFCSSHFSLSLSQNQIQ